MSSNFYRLVLINPGAGDIRRTSMVRNRIRGIPFDAIFTAKTEMAQSVAIMVRGWRQTPIIVHDDLSAPVASLREEVHELTKDTGVANLNGYLRHPQAKALLSFGQQVLDHMRAALENLRRPKPEMPASVAYIGHLPVLPAIGYLAFLDHSLRQFCLYYQFADYDTADLRPGGDTHEALGRMFREGY